MFESSRLADLDGEATAAYIAARHRDLVQAEADLMAAVVHFADIHNGETLDSAGAPLPGMERAVRRGGPGTPTVAEFAHAEIAALQDVHPASAASQMADGQDLVHRLPRLWALARIGHVRIWKARKVAAWTRQLSLEQAGWVDEQVAGYAMSLPFGRFELLVRAKIIEADPEAEEARREAAEAERFVRTGRANEHGLKVLVAKASAGDVIWFVAMCDRIATILRANGATGSLDVLRSQAIGILANPAHALALLAGFDASRTPMPAGDPSADPGEGSGGGDDDSVEPYQPDPVEDPDHIGEDDVHPALNDADEQQGDAPSDQSDFGGGTGYPSPRWDGSTTPFGGGLPQAELSKLRPPAVLYIHLSQDSFTRDPVTGVARFEGHGPISAQQAREFLGDHCQVIIKPVIDLATATPVDAYETPNRLREALHLRTPADVFPFATSLARNVDIDHTVSHIDVDEGGPPGQTSLDNLGPMARFHHRIKTHGRWQVRQPESGVYLWRSPFGYYYMVNESGTCPLSRSIGAAAWAHAADSPSAPVIDLWRSAVSFEPESYPAA